MADPAVRALVSNRVGRRWCLFVDRDGVLNRRIVDDYVRNWEAFEWLPGAKDALKTLRAWAPYLVVVTNQQGVGKRLMTAEDVTTIHERMQRDLAACNVTIDAFRVCPHLAGSGCSCRKPQPGMVLDWLDQHRDCEPSLSVMVGDSRSDIEMAGNVAEVTGGCAAIEIRESGQGHTSPGTVASFGSLWDFAAAVEHAMEEHIS